MSRGRLLLLALLTSGCSQQVIDPAFVGTFELKSRDGRPLPAPLPVTYNDRQCTNEMLQSTLTISSSGQWIERYRARRDCGPDGTEGNDAVVREERGTATHPGNDRHSLQFTSPEPANDGFDQYATVEGDQLRMRSVQPQFQIDMPFVYQRTSR